MNTINDFSEYLDVTHPNKQRVNFEAIALNSKKKTLSNGRLELDSSVISDRLGVSGYAGYYYPEDVKQSQNKEFCSSITELTIKDINVSEVYTLSVRGSYCTTMCDHIEIFIAKI